MAPALPLPRGESAAPASSSSAQVSLVELGSGEVRRSESGGLSNVSNAERGLQASLAADAFEEADKDGNRRLTLGEFIDCQRRLGHGMSAAQAELVFNVWSVVLVDGEAQERVITATQFYKWWLTDAHLAASENLKIFKVLSLPNRAETCGGKFALAWCTLELSGVSLPAMDWKKPGVRGKSDPYFKVLLLTRAKNAKTVPVLLKTSEVKEKNLNPLWKAVAFAVDVPSNVLSMSDQDKCVALSNIDIEIEVWDEDRSNPDDRIGNFCATLGDIVKSAPGTECTLEKPKRTFKNPRPPKNPGKLCLRKCDVQYLPGNAGKSSAETPGQAGN